MKVSVKFNIIVPRGTTTNTLSTDTRDPIERYGALAFKIAVYGWLSYFFYQAIVAFAEYVPTEPWPFMLSIFRMFTFLPIHEAGHFIFSPFGRTLHILGGSFWQIFFPFLWFIIALKQRSHVAPFALFWVGENFMDVSLYMRDAPVRQMPLLGGHKSGHDWYNLFTEWNLLGSAETFADVFYFFGCIVCAGAIAAGLYLAVYSYLNPEPTLRPVTQVRGKSIKVENALDTLISDKESQEKRLDES